MSVAAAVAGGLVSSAGQLFANQQTLQANNERFGDQINLANTAHQREIQDLQAAGLNPILSASGSGAPVPSLGTPELGNAGTGIGEAIQSAARLASLDIPLKESQIAVNSAQAENLLSDGVLKRAQADVVNAGVHTAESLKDKSEGFGEKVGEWIGKNIKNPFRPESSPPSARKFGKPESQAVKPKPLNVNRAAPVSVRKPGTYKPRTRSNRSTVIVAH